APGSGYRTLPDGRVSAVEKRARGCCQTTHRFLRPSGCRPKLSSPVVQVQAYLDSDNSHPYLPPTRRAPRENVPRLRSPKSWGFERGHYSGLSQTPRNPRAYESSWPAHRESYFIFCLNGWTRQRSCSTSPNELWRFRRIALASM